MNVYLDSSALVKGYVLEDGSTEVAALMDRADVAGSAWIAIPEVISAFARAGRSAALPESVADEARLLFLADEPNYVWLSVDRHVVDAAGGLAWRHGLRGFDATHLAAGLRWQAELDDRALVFATFDKRLATAARAEALVVWPEEQ